VTQKSDLETAMRSGIAVLAADDCHGIRLLAGCHASGHYGYLGHLPQRSTVDLRTADELRINAPLAGSTPEGDAAATATRVETTTVGVRATTRGLLSPEELTGECTGATHFVGSAEIGAEVTLPGAKDGKTGPTDPHRMDASDPCGGATPEAVQPPSGCGAMIGIRIHPIAPLGDLMSFDKAPADAVVPIGMCPEAWVVSKGRCVKAPADGPYLCTFGDAPGCREQCRRGDINSCDVLGFMLWHGQGVAKDLALAAATYDKGCQHGDSIACSNLAAFHYDGVGLAKDPSKGVKLFERACDLGDVVACGNLGIAVLAGVGVAPDEARGTSLLERACGAGSADACNHLALELRTTKNGKADAARAHAILEQACDGDNGSSCLELGKNHYLGEGVPSDRSRAAVLFKRACRAGSDDGCVMLGLQYRQADGVERNDILATRLMGQACSHGYQEGCFNLGIAYENGKGVAEDAARAAELYEQACNAQVARACFFFGDALSGGVGVPSDAKRATTSYAKACALGEKEACAHSH
jgi:uncharacterized protein